MSLYYANYGDWRKLFTALDALNKVTAEDVQRVAQMYFISVNRTLAYTAPPRSTAVGGRP
jgi:predicted Zn-dependent peptidase